MDTPLEPTAPVIDGGVHVKVEGTARSVLISEKADVELHLLRGDDIELVSRDMGITAPTVSVRRDQFLTCGQAGLKSHAADGHDDELAQLKALVGDLTMRVERSREAIQR